MILNDCLKEFVFDCRLRKLRKKKLNPIAETVKDYFSIWRMNTK